MEKDLELRTKRFALAVIKFTSSLPSTRELDILTRQLVRAATSIGANYREANRGVSRADFANKIGTVQKEAAETQYWLELLIESNLCPNQAAATLQEESSELLAIFTSMARNLSSDCFLHSTLPFLKARS